MQRKNIETILVNRADYPEPHAVMISIYDKKIGLGLAGWGDVEVWLSRDECKHVILAFEGALYRQSLNNQDFSFCELFSQQVNNEGSLVPAIILVSPHKGEMGLFIVIKDYDGGSVWMDIDSCEKIVKSLMHSLEILEESISRI